MRKLILALGLLLLVPTMAFARGGGFSGSAHSSVGSFHSSSSFSSGRSGSIGSSGAFHSSGGTGIGSGSHSYYGGGYRSYYSSDYNNYHYDYFPSWLIWYTIWDSGQHNATINKSDTFEVHDHMPYVVAIDKTAHSYKVYRYIGADNKNEVVSPQEQAGLSWLNTEVKY